MPTLYRRAHLPRQESLRTEPMVYPGEACTEIGADEPRNARPLHREALEFFRGLLSTWRWLRRD